MKPFSILFRLIFLHLFWTLNCLEPRHSPRHRLRETAVKPQCKSKMVPEIGYDVLHDEMSILDTYPVETGSPLTGFLDLEEIEESPLICTGNKSDAFKAQIWKFLVNTLKFYQSHMDRLPPAADESIGLAFLKAVDDKHGGKFQARYPLSKWMDKMCNKTRGEEKQSCEQITSSWIRHKPHSWKSANTLKRIEIDFKLVGTEEEYIWGYINGECQSALLFRCDVPYLCQITLYDPVPRSMSFLSHQLFQRILTEQSNCVEAKKLLSEEVNHQLCSKMYHEARLISKLDYPFILRDVFAEYVGFCGYMGYPNFFREDWIQAMLSWQSQSEYGCFTDGNYKSKFVTGDSPIVRRKTEEELQTGTKKKESCLPHFTSVVFSALALGWDYMGEYCK